MADPEQQRPQNQQNESDQEDNGGPRARRRRADAMPLENLLRLLAGQRVMVERREAAGSNDELVAGLKRSGMLTR